MNEKAVAVHMLRPGDKVRFLDRTATFIMQTGHPVWPHMQLVVWRLDDGEISLDALSFRQSVGELIPQDDSERQVSLRAALTREA